MERSDSGVDGLTVYMAPRFFAAADGVETAKATPKTPPKPRNRKPPPQQAPSSSSSDSSDSEVDRISDWKKRDEERRKELEERRRKEQEEEIRRLREQEKEEEEAKKREKAEKADAESDSSKDGGVMNDGSPKKVKKPKTRPALSSDSDLEKEVKHEKIPKKKRPSATDGPVKRGKKAQAHRSSSSGSDSEREREVRKPVKKRSSESPRKPGQKEKPKVRPSKVEKPKKKPELASERRVEKKKEPSVEEKLQKLHSDIKFALKVDNPDIKKCLDALEELGSLQVTSHILQKNTDLVATLKKIRRYKANKDVMEKAAEVYTRLKSRVLGPKLEALQKGGKVESDEGQQDSVQNDSQPMDEDGEKGPETKKEMDKVELSAPMNGDSTSQRSESGEDKECEDEQTSVSEKKTSPAALKTALQDDSLLEKVNTDHRDIEEKTAYRESEATNES